MFNITKQEIEWGGRSLILETGRVARQADGAVIVTYGGTSVLCTVVMKREPMAGADFFPLNVHYKEMFYAAGKIPGGFFKREGRPSDKEAVICRLIDRPIRPLFPDGFYNEVQILCSVISYDGENSADIPALIGTSAALAISGIPFPSILAASRIGLADDKFILNPISKKEEAPVLDLIVAGTKDAILMVEAEAQELSEDKMLKAIDFAQKGFQPVITMIKAFKKAAGKADIKVEATSFDAKLVKKIESIAEKELSKILKITDKKERTEKADLLKHKVFDKIDPEPELKQSVSSIFKSIKERIVRGNVLKGVRIDGRDAKTIRPITAEVSILPRTHGSALFTRGETQAMVITTLGGPQDEQIVDAMDRDAKEHFLLHYNFPPYSVGEAKPMRGVSRREVGHGKLAWKAIRPMLPLREKFPYTIRVVSEITESNGSSSMATVCGTTLALMDAGVPLVKPVAGVAMGLIKEDKKFVVLSDILGDEDSLGDMDFKVAGTADGITALQMDIKVHGITKEIMEVALKQAQDGRLSILKNISEALAVPRDGISKFAPSIVQIKIKKEKIGAVVGPGGKMIKEICAQTGAEVNIDDNGMVSVTAIGKEATDKAVKMIVDIAVDPEIGRVYDGVVKQILDFGAVVSFLNREGLLHISEISHERVKSVDDVLKIGEKIKVKLVESDPYRGKFRLSIKAIDDGGPSKGSSADTKKGCADDTKEGCAGDEIDAPCKKDQVASSSVGDGDVEEVNYNREGTSYEHRNSMEQPRRRREVGRDTRGGGRGGSSSFRGGSSSFRGGRGAPAGRGAPRDGAPGRDAPRDGWNREGPRAERPYGDRRPARPGTRSDGPRPGPRRDGPRSDGPRGPRRDGPRSGPRRDGPARSSDRDEGSRPESKKKYFNI